MKENQNPMISSFKLKTPNKKDLSPQKVKAFNSLFIYQDLIYSKSFWICSVYFFLSITLLTGIHMYEYFKCFLC